MKLKIKITGPKVHEVGYRYFLMSNAMDLGLKGFHARNRGRGKEQEVIALVEGDEEAVSDFRALVDTDKPERAKVSKVTVEDYEGDVMRTGEYAQVCTALQLNKAIPILLEVRDNTKAISQIAEDMEGLREDLIKRSDVRLARIEKDIRVVKSKLGIR